MAKSSKEQIEDDEKKVIIELKKNSNESIGGLAKKCGFSRQKVWRIVKRFEKNNIIWGYNAVVDEEHLNIKGFLLLIKLKHLPIENKLENEIANGGLENIANNFGIIIEDNVWIHGEYDIVMNFSAFDLKTAKRFHEILITAWTDNIEDSKLFEKIVTIKKNGFINPRINKTKKLLEY
jgi:DNA-binding Lrp family transcriptional regulator